MKEKHLRAIGAGIIAALSALVAAGTNEPGSTWEIVQLCAGVLGAGLTAAMAFLSKHSGLNP